jgi:hypothetical protein
VLAVRSICVPAARRFVAVFSRAVGAPCVVRKSRPRPPPPPPHPHHPSPQNLLYGVKFHPRQTNAWLIGSALSLVFDCVAMEPLSLLVSVVVAFVAAAAKQGVPAVLAEPLRARSLAVARPWLKTFQR